MSKRLFNQDTGVVKKPSKKILWLIPAMLLATALIFGYIFKDKLLPSKKINAVRVTAIKDGDKKISSISKVLFQAAGWIEPAPYEIDVSALVSGVVKEVNIIDGQDIKKNDILAILDQTLFKTQLMQTKAEYTASKAKILPFQAELKIKKAELEQVDEKLKVIQAKILKAKDLAEKNKSAGDSISGLEISQSALDLKIQQANYKDTEKSKDIIKAQIQKIINSIKETEAEISIALRAWELQKAIFDQTIIRAPVSGRVLKRYAYPGRKQVLNSDYKYSVTICSIYNPKKMQVRVDVPLADAGSLFVGQKAKIKTDSLGKNELDGILTSINGEADIQKNTIEVKIKIITPPDTLRPEMLARVQFFGSSKKKIKDSSGYGLLIKKSALCNIEGEKAKVWIINPETGIISSKEVIFTKEEKDWVKVEGLTPGALVVDDNPVDLKDGSKVIIQNIKEL